MVSDQGHDTYDPRKLQSNNFFSTMLHVAKPAPTDRISEPAIVLK